MSFYRTDAEYREHLEHQVVTQGEYRLTYDDRLLLKILQECKITHCGLCGAPVRHSIESECAGHGDYPRFLKISCQNVKCRFTIRDCIDYGLDWRNVERDFVNRCEEIKQSILSRYNGIEDKITKQKGEEKQ